ncbi:MAG: hypothetical protein U1E05_02755, partial [Patescibacteria group bacterium]|nr:hypothetical protein [Patescibacteria group bacterium]
MRTIVSLFLNIAICFAAAVVANASNAAGDAPTTPIPLPAAKAVILEAESAQINTARAEAVEQPSFDSKRGVSLKDGAAANVGEPAAEPDLVIPIQVAEA